MQTVYHAQNDIDAQLAVDRLAADGIEAHVFGRFLSSASGELPAQSMIRVQVDDAQFERASNIIALWQSEMNSTADDTDLSENIDASENRAPSPAGRTSKSSSGVGTLLVGILIGAVGAWFLLRIPETGEDFDFDGDGVVDMRYVYGGQQLKRIDYDRDANGVPDFRDHPSSRKYGDSMQWSDDDFDGRFEIRTEVRKGWPAVSHYDANGDGFEEARIVYRHGVADEFIFMAPPDGRVIKRVQFKDGQTATSEADLDNDGHFETRWTYDEIGEPTKVESPE